MNVERHQREALSFDGTDQFSNLAAVQQQLARAARLVIELIALLVGRDVRVEEKHFAVVHDRVRIRDVRLSRAQRFDLRTRKHDAGLPRIQEMIIVPGALVPRDGGERLRCRVVCCGQGRGMTAFTDRRKAARNCQVMDDRARGKLDPSGDAGNTAVRST